MGGRLIDPLHLAIALVPLAAYFVLLGLINVARRPLLATGARDTAALGLAISGLIVAGPMELFFPEAAANEMGAYVWLFLIAFYSLVLTLIVLLLRPRLLIYNVRPDQFRPALAEAVSRLDDQARWAGDCLVIPRLGVQLHVEPVGAMRVVQLIAVGPKQNDVGWRQLEAELAKALKSRQGSANPHGYVFLAVGLTMLTVVCYQVMTHHVEVVQTLHEMLRW